VEAFKNQLEKVYKLCGECELRVRQELEQQDATISMHLNNMEESQRSFMQQEADDNCGEYTFLVS